MCPNTLILYFVFIAVIAVHFFVYRRISQCASANFDILGTLVGSSQRTTSFFQATFTGFYKGRKIELRCPFFDKGSPRTFSIEPLQVPAPQKLFVLEYPRPTSNTQLKNNKIFFSPAGFFTKSESYYKIYGREEIIRILDELTEAAHYVESGGK
jgi:hypothetical protein